MKATLYTTYDHCDNDARAMRHQSVMTAQKYSYVSGRKKLRASCTQRANFARKVTVFIIHLIRTLLSCEHGVSTLL